jgi:hypothetical protein
VQRVQDPEDGIQGHTRGPFVSVSDNQWSKPARVSVCGWCARCGVVRRKDSKPTIEVNLCYYYSLVSRHHGDVVYKNPGDPMSGCACQRTLLIGDIHCPPEAAFGNGLRARGNPNTRQW